MQSFCNFPQKLSIKNTNFKRLWFRIRFFNNWYMLETTVQPRTSLDFYNKSLPSSFFTLQMKGWWESNINVWFPFTYIFPEMKLLFPKQNYNVLSPSSYTKISGRFLYISRIGLPFLLQGNIWTDPGNYRSQTHECGNWDWGRAIPIKRIHKWDFLCSVD